MNHSQDYYRHHMYRVAENRNELWNKRGYLSAPEENSTRFSKQHPFDCGTPECIWCHHEKLGKRRFALKTPDIDLWSEWGVVEPEEFLS